jgi:para-nitrobenzyl esterase
VFDHLSQESWAWSDVDRAIANAMATYVTNFAKNGDPNGAGVTAWPNFTSDNERLLHIGDTLTVEGIPNLAGLRRLDLRYQALRSTARVTHE